MREFQFVFYETGKNLLPATIPPIVAGESASPLPPLKYAAKSVRYFLLGPSFSTGVLIVIQNFFVISYGALFTEDLT